MPKADLLSRLGLFVRKGFLDPSTCSRLRSAMGPADGAPATVARKTGEVVDEYSRRTKWLAVSKDFVELVNAQLLAIQPEIAAHFKLELRGHEEPQFLRYRAGDFFIPHRDASQGDRPENFRRRRVSVVIFVNSPSEQPGEGTYAGGKLTFFGLIDKPEWQRFGFPLIAEEGLLVAFPADILHEVTPVERGERFTIVSWFF